MSKQVHRIGIKDIRLTRSSFQTNIRKNFSDSNGNIDFAELGKQTSVFFRTIPNLSFMLGPLKQERKIRKKVVRQRKPKYVKEEALEVVNNPNKTNEKTEHKKLQAIILSQVQKHSGDDLFKVLINPNSFTQTVENIFEFGFLVTDGWAGVEVDKEGVPKIIATSPNESTNLSKTSSVLSLSFSQYEKLIKVLNIKKSVIPHRKDRVYEKEYIFNPREADLTAKPKNSRKRKSISNSQ